MNRLATTLALALTVAVGAPADATAQSASNPCTGRGTAIQIDTQKHQLRLCHQGAVVAGYRIAIGSAGTPKQKQGDRKTPLGRYPLGQPRPSRVHKIFIPVGYPTAAQRNAGYTGSSIGIHGPKRDFTWAGQWSTLLDWTQGCIAVATDQAIAEIAAWVDREKPSAVYLE